MAKIIGRKEEIRILDSAYQSSKSDFIAIYGRRRVGKTYLVRSVFENKLTFQVTAIAKTSLKSQLKNFYKALNKTDKLNQYKATENWFDAFDDLAKFLENSEDHKKVIFIDELPWFDSQNSGFIQALDHFWNSWASTRTDILLIVCGSAASWMINKLINNEGGLHNRVTKRIKVIPFTLKECKIFIENKNAAIDNYQIIQLYMVFGGIPYYWDEISTEYGAMQNIANICFARNGLLRNEYQNLYRALFKNHEKHELVINALAEKNIGITRLDILKATKMNNGGSLTRILNELEESGFIKKYTPFGKQKREGLFQLTDFYSKFYITFMKNVDLENFDWLAMQDNPKYRAWSGFAFEQVVMQHISEIKFALGISGVHTEISSWRSTNSNNGAQIDLVIDRRDQVINLLEMKYSIKNYTIDKNYNQELRNKIGIFKEETETKKSVFLTMITTFGVTKNEYFSGIVQNSITMDALFE